MKLLGFSFEKISIEKLSSLPDKLKISTNIDLPEIKKADADFIKEKEEIIAVKFTFTVDYSPNFVKIELKGTILISVDSKTSKEILKQWKDKQIPEKFKFAAFNTILRKANVKALQLEEEMGLPLHINLPYLKKQDEKE